VRARACLILAAFGAFGPVAAGQAPPDPRWIEKVVPRMADAGAQLAHARRLKRELATKRGDEQVFWRKLAVEAYQAVRLFHPEARELATEAAFRAGEILRTADECEGALAEFRWSAAHGQGTDFRARARLEIGHLERRAERWREALEAYMDVAADARAAPARRDDGWLWAGRAWRALGRADDARAAWKRVAEQGSVDLLRIEAFDELALTWLADGDLEASAGELARCLELLSPRALEETDAGERVRDALLRMRVVDELQRALARRAGANDATRTTRSP
jgi:tetratricopeptide (TPR) repeat protein